MLSNILERKNNTEISRQLNSSSHLHTKKFQKMGKLLAISLAIEFLSPEDNLLNILLVNKAWRKALEKKVYRVALSATDEKLSQNKRLELWLSIIKLNDVKLDYFKVKEKYNLLEQNVLIVEDIITLDVQRSFHNHPQINTMVILSQKF
jgi:hypothetical protein